MTGLPVLPKRVSLAALQAYVRDIVVARGFTQDLDRVFILTVEELGELAELLEGKAAPGIELEKLGAELADVALYLADLANGFGIGLDAALRASPPWDARQVPDGAGLDDWQAAAPALPQSHLVSSVPRMVTAAGDVARAVRKRWSGRGNDAPSGPLARLFGEVLRIACICGIDLARAIEDKERENARRIWTY